MADDTAASSPELANMQGQLDKLSKSFEQLNGMFSTMLGHIQAPAKVEEPPKKPADEIVWPEADELEGMSRQQHTELLFRNVAKLIEQSVLAPLRTEIQSVRSEVHQSGALSAIDKARTAHPDFDDFSTEIQAELKDMRQPDLEKAYKLARLAHPDKAKQLDTKYAPAAAAREDDLTAYLPARPGKASGGPVVGGLSVAEAATASFNKFGPEILKAFEGQSP